LSYPIQQEISFLLCGLSCLLKCRLSRCAFCTRLSHLLFRTRLDAFSLFCDIRIQTLLHFFPFGLALPASDKAMAMACFWEVTSGPFFEPECSFPLPNSVITLLIFFWALVFISVQNLGCDCSSYINCAIGS